MKHILFFDLDGTLWNHLEEIPDSAVAAIRKARENGHEIYINTGRSRAAVRCPQLFEMGIDGMVTGDGLMIEARKPGQECLSANWRENQLLKYDELPAELGNETVRILREHNFFCVLEGREYLYADVEEFQGDRFITSLQRRLGDKILPITGNEGKWDFIKLSCDLREAVNREEALDYVRQHYSILDHNGVVMEYVPIGHDKGTGLLDVCRMTGVPRERTIAFGDGRNDIEVFLQAGTAVAMGNGNELAKSHATFVTEAYDQDGIALALEKLGLI